ncbi:hypothetical protein GP484_14205, partial [Mammaliicoccus sciuri]
TVEESKEGTQEETTVEESKEGTQEEASVETSVNYKMTKLVQEKKIEDIDYGSLNSEEFAWLLSYISNNPSTPNNFAINNEQERSSRVRRDVSDQRIEFTTGIDRNIADGRNKILVLKGSYDPTTNQIEWDLNVKLVENTSSEYLFVTVSTENQGKLGEAKITSTSVPFESLGNNSKIGYKNFSGKDGETDPQWRSTDKLKPGQEVTFKFTTPFTGDLDDLRNLDGTDMLFTVKTASLPFQRYQSDFGNNKVHATVSGYGGFNIPEEQPQNDQYEPTAGEVEKPYGEGTTE